MKPILPLFILLFIAPLDSIAQNHVVNGSFERYDKCAQSWTDFTGFCSDWYSYTKGTPGYYNSCDPTNIASVPSNKMGDQAAIHGDAYAGVVTMDYMGTKHPEYAEYIAAPMQPLAKGKQYKVSYHISLADKAMFMTEAPDIYFMIGKNYINAYKPASFTHISFQSYGMISDDKNWKQLTATFVADASYDHIVIGNFRGYDIDMGELPENSERTELFAYYYIDSVTVIENDGIDDDDDGKDRGCVCIPKQIGAACIGDTIFAEYEVPPYSVPFGADNEFILELKDQNGNLIEIGRHKSVSSGKIFTTIGKNVKPGIYWPQLVSTKPRIIFNYEHSMVVQGGPLLVVSANDPVCRGDIEFHAQSSTGSVMWYGPGFTSNSLNPRIGNAGSHHTGTYLAIAENEYCRSIEPVTIAIDCDDIQVPTGFSPNGDGINDILYIYSNGEFSQVALRIYNRWGQLVFYTTDIHAGWDGTYKGTPMDSQTLAYVLHAVSMNGAVTHNSGNITIVK